MIQGAEANFLKSCETTLEPRIFIGTIETGVGLSGIEVPIQCEASGPIHGYHFELKHPSFLTIDSIDAGSGAQVTRTLLGNPASDSTVTLVVTVSGVEILPDAVYSYQAQRAGPDLERVSGGPEAGLTAKYGLTPELVFDGAVNPDFSQVEADAGQIDVNRRYALFFPEKRPFL